MFAVELSLILLAMPTNLQRVKLLPTQDMPLLWMPSPEEPAEEKRGGVVEALHRAHGREIEVVEFERTHGWVTRSDLAAAGQEEDSKSGQNSIIVSRRNSPRVGKYLAKFSRLDQLCQVVTNYAICF